MEFPRVDVVHLYEEKMMQPPYLVFFPGVAQGQDILYLWSFTEEMAAELAEQGGLHIIVMVN